jgi:hypothetical protein
MSDELDSLTNAQLSEAFAVEVDGWKRGTTIEGKPALWPPDKEPPTKRKQGMWPYGISVGDRFATSTDAVLPFLDKHPWNARNGVDYCDGHHRVTITGIGRPGIVSEAFSTTFARAACIALIRAARAQNGSHA